MRICANVDIWLAVYDEESERDQAGVFGMSSAGRRAQRVRVYRSLYTHASSTRDGESGSGERGSLAEPLSDRDIPVSAQAIPWPCSSSAQANNARRLPTAELSPTQLRTSPTTSYGARQSKASKPHVCYPVHSLATLTRRLHRCRPSSAGSCNQLILISLLPNYSCRW